MNFTESEMLLFGLVVALAGIMYNNILKRIDKIEKKIDELTTHLGSE